MHSTSGRFAMASDNATQGIEQGASSQPFPITTQEQFNVLMESLNNTKDSILSLKKFLTDELQSIHNRLLKLETLVSMSLNDWMVMLSLNPHSEKVGKS